MVTNSRLISSMCSRLLHFTHVCTYIINNHIIIGPFFIKIIIIFNICAQIFSSAVDFAIRILGRHLLRGYFSTVLFFGHFMFIWFIVLIINLYRIIWILFSLTTIIWGYYSRIIIRLMSYLFCHCLVRRLRCWLLFFVWPINEC